MSEDANDQSPRRARRSRAEVIALAWRPTAKWQTLAHPPGTTEEVIKETNNKQIALSMYEAHRSTKDIKAKTGVGGREVYLTWLQAVTPDPYGAQPEYAVCAPGYRARFKRAVRPLEKVVAGKNKQGGLSGAKTAFFARYPTIASGIESLAIHGISKYPDGSELRLGEVSDSVIHAEFMKMVSAAGVRADSWPLNTADQGRTTLATHCRELKLYSDDRGADASSTPKDQAAAGFRRAVALTPGSIRPRTVLERCEVDAETVKLMYELKAEVDGRPTVLIDDLRPMNLVARDCAPSGVAIESNLFFARGFYEEWHVLKLIEKMMYPHQRFALPEGLAYPSTPCFPSELKGWDMHLPMEIAWDAAASQMSIQIKHQLYSAIEINCLQELTANPQGRIKIESLFSHSAEADKVAPNATGSSPDSVARQRATESDPFSTAAFSSALKLAHFNSRRPRGMPGSRIAMFEDAFRSGNAFLWPVRPSFRNSLEWSLKPQVQGTIRMYRKEEPYVEAMGARYSGPDLSGMEDLGSYLDKKFAATIAILDNAAEGRLLVSVNPGDPKSALRYIGKVFVQTGYWSTPHKLIDRVALARLPDKLGDEVSRSGASLTVSIAHAIFKAKKSGSLPAIRTLAFNLSDMLLQRQVEPLPGQGKKFDPVFASRLDQSEPQLPPDEEPKTVELKPGSAVAAFETEDD